MRIKNIENIVIDKLPLNSEKKKVLNRRINKLKRDPKGFMKASYEKRSVQIRDSLPIKYNSNNNFSIVTAVYNSEKYLDDYFKSIIKQSLNFQKYINIICVDDGSTDKSAFIIKTWQKKYPNNIIYVYKENGGQATARNIGLELVNSDWVTFVDSDDFLSRNYFYQVEKAIASNNNIRMVCCNQIYFFEDTNEYIDRHPLNFRFRNNDNIVPCNDLKKNIQFSAALAFFHAKSIPRGLRFDEALRPTFEDGKFVNAFLLYQQSSSQVYFNSEAKYFNRKRADKSSTMDNVWFHKGQFSTVIEKGYIDILLESCQTLGYVPRHLQRTILWEMLRLVKYLLNHEERVSFLNAEEKKNLLHLMDRVFKFIDKDVILSYELGNCGFSRQLGMLGTFKNVDVDTQVAYIDKVDYSKNIFLIRFFSSFEITFKVYSDSEEQEFLPVFYKKSDRLFLDRVFLTEHRLWCPIPMSGTMNIAINGKNAFINYDRKKYKQGLPVKFLYENFEKKNTASAWILMDRDDRAGDNAEFLYNFIMKERPEKELYFILNQDSIDWERLERQNFNLIAHGSDEHRSILEKGSLLISSQVGYILEPFKGLNSSYRRIFLQHGVIKDDLSNWLNNIKTDLLITSTFEEYESIVQDNSKYNYTEKEVKLTGLPRFDSLYKNKDIYKKQVLIMFTWRKSITGTFVTNDKSKRQLNQNFKSTRYYKEVNSLLNNKVIKDLSENYELNFILCPHPNMEDYIDSFDIPREVTIASNRKMIHDLVNESAIVITDFSSIAFDFAYQEKPVLYYQFDQDEIFSGGHTYQQGYFSYEDDGFGPVVTKEEDLLIELEKVMVNNVEPLEPYATRIKNTFAYHDTNNCQRVYEAIINLDRPDNAVASVDTIMSYAQQAIIHESWDLALERIDNALEHTDITSAQIDEIMQMKEEVIHTGYKDQPIKLANVLWQENRLSEALGQLEQIESIEVTDELLRLRVKLAILNDDFILARDSQKLLLESYSDTCTIEDWQFYTQLATI